MYDNKESFRFLLYSITLVWLSVSCQKEINEVEPGEYSQLDGPKAEPVNTVRFSWKGGETVYVFDGTHCLGSLVASLDGTEDRYAILSTEGDKHKVFNPAERTTKLTLVYYC